MRLDRFTADGVHGYLQIDIRFRSDLTFLTGINGSGKTTAINAIVALLTPDLATLSNLEYVKLSLDLIHDGEKITVSCRRDENSFELSIKGLDEALRLPRYVISSDLSMGKQVEHESEYFKDLANTNAAHPVMRTLAKLPTPMFLGLDRRSRFDLDDRRRFFMPHRMPRPARSVFGLTSARSLHEAAELAATSNRDAIISAARIGDDLRREMLLNLLTASPEDFGDLSTPTRRDVIELEQIRRDLDAFPRIFNLPRDEVQKRILPFLDDIQKAVASIPADIKAEEVIREKKVSSDVLSALFKWSANRTHFKRIRVISDAVQRYNERRAVLLEPVRRYQELVNAFLKDSGKSIAFDDDGYVHVSVEGANAPKDISMLSSGEAQIFVILTHLSLSKSAQEANVFIIDEPELSLHVLWQELFVDSVQAANPKIQYIMATHSPSIILDKTKNCVDVSVKSRRGRRG